MDEVIEKKRFLWAMLPNVDQLKKVRIMGAPQTGKTVFSKHVNISENKPKHNVIENINHYELFPLTLAELYADKKNNLKFPLIDKVLMGGKLENILNSIPTVLPSEEEASRKKAQQNMLAFGGFPALLHIADKDKFYWLQNYVSHYLSNKMTTLIRSAVLLNYSELARGAGISVDTARRYIESLRQAYQLELLQPYHTNITSTVIKTPKLYWLDVGVMRALSGFHGELNSYLYETFVVSECIKWIRTSRRNINLGIEITSRANVFPKDITPMKELAKILNTEWLGGLVIYNGDHIKKMAEPNIWALPSWRILI
jgi:predicted AAA+ superfamily ATPase